MNSWGHNLIISDMRRTLTAGWMEMQDGIWREKSGPFYLNIKTFRLYFCGLQHKLKGEFCVFSLMLSSHF